MTSISTRVKYVDIKLYQLVDVGKDNNFKKNVLWFGEPGPKCRLFLICQSTAINQK